MKFNELALSEAVLRAVDKVGYTEPSPIQEQAIPHIIEGRDILGCAQTGTGKTAAFSLPMIDRFSIDKVPSGRGTTKSLILTPTRELAVQIYENIREYSQFAKVRSTVVFGGVSQKTQEQKLRVGVDILVATPGRLIDLVNQGIVSLSKVEVLVLDEADRMLDMGFIHDVNRVIELVPKERQTLFFSATMPKEIVALSSSILTDPIHVEVTPASTPVETIEQYLYYVDRANKKHLLAMLLEDKSLSSVLIFTKTKHGANRVVDELEDLGIEAMAIHGNKSQTARQEALNSFKSGKLRILVATDIASRGIDVDKLSHVINYDLCDVPETYVHRIGRTGRAGESGVAISFCDFDDKNNLKDIERLIKKPLTVVEDHPYPMQVFQKREKTPRGTRPAPKTGERSGKTAGRNQRGGKPSVGKSAKPRDKEAERAKYFANKRKAEAGKKKNTKGEKRVWVPKDEM